MKVDQRSLADILFDIQLKPLSMGSLRSDGSYESIVLSGEELKQTQLSEIQIEQAFLVDTDISGSKCVSLAP